MDDQTLINGCIKGESRYQKQLYEKYAPEMMSICLRYVREKETACDLMHDGFVTLFTKIHTYSGNASLLTWIKKIFINTILDYYRKNDILRFSTDIYDVYYLEDTSVSVFEQMSANELLECIGRLPDGYRTVFNMYAIEGYSHAEIAQLLNIQESASRSQYVRARQSLQKMVTKQTQFSIE